MYNTPENIDLSDTPTDIMIDPDESGIEIFIDEEPEDPYLLITDFFDEKEIEGVLTFLPKPNITDLVSDDDLSKIGCRVVEGFNFDKGTMDEWAKNIEDGFELAKQENKPKNYPFEKSANYKTPVVIEAALKFSDRASSELLSKKDLINFSLTGKFTDEKEAQADRVKQYLNFQLDEKIEEWRDEQEKLLYDLPYVGAVFKKVFYDHETGQPSSSLITYPDFVLDNNIHSFKKLKRFSEEFFLSKNEVIEKIRSGLWRDVEKSIYDSVDTEEVGSDDDKFQLFIEQQGFYDIDGDGYEEPYTFIVHKSTETVVRIIPRFKYQDIIIKDIKRGEVSITSDEIEFSSEQKIQIVRINPESNLIQYTFMKDPDGGLLGIGYAYLLSALASGINASMNQLFDAGKLANLPGGMIAKGFRAKMGDIRVKPGEFFQTGLAAQDLQNGIYTFPFKEPSQTLFALSQSLVAEARELSASADLKGAMSVNAPATTTLALVQEQQESSGAIILRIYRAMSKEFKKIFEIDAVYADPNEYMEVVDDETANFYTDFDLKRFNITPNANPNFASKIQRLQLAEAAFSKIEQVMMAGGNPRPIIRFYYETINADYVDEIVPELTPDERLIQLFSENPELEAMVMEEKQRADLLAAAEADRVEKQEIRDQIAFNAEIAIKRREEQKIAQEVEKISAETKLKDTEEDKVIAQTYKTYEEADTEQEKNNNDDYSSKYTRISNNNEVNNAIDNIR